MPEERTTASNIETGEGDDAKGFLTTWRMARPDEFYREVDALVAEIKAMPRDPFWIDAEARA